MNSEQLRYFELAYTEGNFSAAARRVPVSHQGLTKSIRALEKELGVELFTCDPDTGKPVPTVYAHELFEFAAVYHSNVRLLNESFARLRNDEGSTIRLGCSLGVIGAFGPMFLDRFMEAHPGVDVHYWESNDRLCEQGLLADHYDLALMVSPATEQCTSVPLYRSPVYFWVKRDDPLAQRAADGLRLGIEDLAGRNIAIPGSGFKCFEQLTRLADERKVRLGRLFEMSEIFQLYGYAAQGHALGFANGTLIDLPVFTNDSSLTAVPIDGLDWEFGIECLATHALGEAERQLWDWCVSAAKDLPGNQIA